MRFTLVRLTLVLLTVFSFGLQAQMPVPLEFGECDQPYPEADDWSRKGIRALRNGDEVNARRYARLALEANSRDAHGFFLMGYVAFTTGKIAEAQANWTQCLAICPDYNAEMQYLLGIMKIESGKTEEGEKLISTYLENPMRNGSFDEEAEEYLEQALIIAELMENPVDFDPRVVRGVSTPADEYLCSISPDGEMMFYTRREMKRPRHSGPSDRARLVETFTVSRMTQRGFDRGEDMPLPFNDNYNEGSPTISADNRILVFTSCELMPNEYKNCDLYYSIRNGDTWSPIQSLGANVNKADSWESQATISANGNRIYFASNREGGVGGLDIWMTNRLPDGTWSEPINLGEPVNTPGDEKSPFIHSDSKTLYFASTGHPGMGGWDVFYARQNSSLEFEQPVNIGYPINNTTDELGLFVDLDGVTAYFNSKDLRGPGGWDLYQIDLPEEARPEEVALVRGTLRDESGEIVTDADLVLKNISTQEETRIDVDDENGEYTAVVTLSENEDVILKVDREGAAFSSKYIDVDDTESGVVEGDLEVAELSVGREYRLNDINFATDSYELTQNARTIIREFAIFLEENPSVKVDIQGHTDNVGEDASNLTLSQNRARVVYEYLIDMGIASNRMTHHGFGEQKPVETNSTEAGRAKNRRTIFVIKAI
ncbi:MAG: PD40 domain-containing protein [Flavobacteriia bacterium]|nr:PD40 domain-containing protein [Flavobacteriia bacterium]